MVLKKTAKGMSEMQIYAHRTISLINTVGWAVCRQKDETIVKFTTLRQRVARNVSFQYFSEFVKFWAEVAIKSGLVAQHYLRLDCSVSKLYGQRRLI